MRGSRRSDGMIRLGGAPAARCRGSRPGHGVEGAGKARIEPVPRALVELVARDRHFATLYALHATDRLFRAAGSQALFEGNELQRCLRDVHSVASRTTRLGAIAGPAGAT
jgi:hypothetical protein